MKAKKIVSDMIGKNNSGSQYTFDYSDRKYNPTTAPPEYFKVMYGKNGIKKDIGKNNTVVGIGICEDCGEKAKLHYIGSGSIEHVCTKCLQKKMRRGWT